MKQIVKSKYAYNPVYNYAILYITMLNTTHTIN